MRLPGGIREATPADVPDLLRLVHDLAAFQRHADAVVNTEERLTVALFGPRPLASALVAEVDGAVAGMAIWYPTYSTWTGAAGLHLEDLFVAEEHRGRGLGQRFFTALARTAVDRGYARFEWQVLDWNTPAIRFYDAIGGHPLDDSITYRIDGPRLSDLAGG
jgi:GNAT superfamily N-acetyltransferase